MDSHSDTKITEGKRKAGLQRRPGTSAHNVERIEKKVTILQLPM